MISDPLSQLSFEEKLVLFLCRLDFSEEQKSEIRELMKGVKDWDHFVRLVNDHGIIALAAYNIRESGLADLVPSGTMKTLDNARMQSMIRNTWLAKRWKEVNTILTDAGIKHVLLKGMALEHTVYGARGLRQMTDNDILVKKEDVMKAWLLLQSHEFKSDIIKSPLHRKIITYIGKHMPTLRKDGYAVEVHHRLFQDQEKNDNLNEAIDNSREIDVEGTKAFILTDGLHIDYLKEHLNYHRVSGGSQLRLYLDLELMSQGSAPPYPEGFPANPDQSDSHEQSRNLYRAQFFSLPRRLRSRFLTGDIFPSLKWMKQRHGCGWAKAILYYPQRIGKVVSLMKGLNKGILYINEI